MAHELAWEPSAEVTGSVPVPPRRWVTLSTGSDGISAEPPLRPARVYAQVIAVAILVVVAVAFFGAFTSRQAAERQAVDIAAQRADILADAVVQPALRNGIIDQDPAAVNRLRIAVEDQVMGPTITRVKFWTAEGLVVYSSDPRLVGLTFPLSDDHRAVLAHPSLRAEVTNLDEPENTFERGEGKLLEVYRPVWTPDGRALVMETYSPYSTVDQRTGEVWRDFATITIVSLLVLVLLLLPVLWRLIQRLHLSQAQRQALLERAVDASAQERRRIAATLHDGVVQELVGASFVVSGAAVRAEGEGRHKAADELRGAAATVRSSIGGLRSLLVDIYPPSLASTGLKAALSDLVASLRTRQIAVDLECSYDGVSLGKDGERLVFRVAQECLRNAARHSAATAATVRLAPDGNNIVLDVVDNGIGFDPEQLLAQPKEGHFGLRLMADSATQGSARLRVASAPGAGAHWQLRVPMEQS
jgi:signal transduction histidine kinase